MKFIDQRMRLMASDQCMEQMKSPPNRKRKRSSKLRTAKKQNRDRKRTDERTEDDRGRTMEQRDFKAESRQTQSSHCRRAKWVSELLKQRTEWRSITQIQSEIGSAFNSRYVFKFFRFKSSKSKGGQNSRTGDWREVRREGSSANMYSFISGFFF